MSRDYVVKKISVNIILCFTLLITITITVHAKQAFFNFTNVAQEFGSDSTSVNTILQDSSGFIWVGTQNGLLRYDGYDFVKYQHKSDEISSLAHDYVQTLFEDKSGTLWVGTATGILHQYHAKSNNFSRFSFDNALPEDINRVSVITAITQENDNTLWVTGLGGGLSRFDLSLKRFTQNFSHQADNENSLSDDFTYDVLQDRKGLVWIATLKGGLTSYNPITNQFKRYLHQPDNSKSLSNNIIVTLLEDSKGVLWIGTKGGLNRFNASNESFTHFQHDPDKVISLSSNLVHTLYEDTSGTLWVGTRNKGLNRFDSTTQTFSRYMNDPTNNKSLVSDRVRSIIQDKIGNLWVGTMEGGLSHFRPNSTRFGLNKHQSANANSLSKGAINEMYKDKTGILWIGSSTGLDRYDEKKEEWTHYKAAHDIKGSGVSHSISNNDVRAIFEDSHGVLWVGTVNGGLNRVIRFDKNNKPLKPQNYSFYHYKESPSNNLSLSDNIVLDINEDSVGRLWVGTSNGLNLFNRPQNNFIRFVHDKNDAKSFSGSTVLSIFNDNEGRLWIGTQSDGLTLVVDNKIAEGIKNIQSPYHFVQFRHNPKDDTSLSSNTIYSIAQDAKGMLWLGTGAGLDRFYPKTKRVSRASTENGLVSWRIHHVIIDETDNIWISSSSGISLLAYEVANKAKILKVVNHIGAEAGCYANQGASFQGRDGRLYWGANDQYCAFFPEQAIQPSVVPTLAFTDFKLLNKSVAVSTFENPSPLTQPINHTSSITLGYQDNILAFEFAALHFANPKANQYQYKLEGFNKGWVSTDWKNRKATYTNLAAGNYTFKVKASNDAGKWNEKGRSIELIIQPPPWRSWWAYTIYLAMFTIWSMCFLWVGWSTRIILRKISSD